MTNHNYGERPTRHKVAGLGDSGRENELAISPAIAGAPYPLRLVGCTDCEGTGLVSYQHPNDPREAILFKCPTCLGDGEVSE